VTKKVTAYVCPLAWISLSAKKSHGYPVRVGYRPICNILVCTIAVPPLCSLVLPREAKCCNLYNIESLAMYCRREKCTRFCWESANEREHSEDREVDGIRMDLGRLAIGWGWSGFSWLGMRTGDGLLWTVMNLWVLSQRSYLVGWLVSFECTSYNEWADSIEYSTCFTPLC
jgi:hypothetical protein